MKILLVTNMYPTSDRPNYGIFVKEQVEAVKSCFPDVEYDVYYIEGQSSKMSYVKSIFKINRSINRNDYDLVHVHYGLSGLFLLYPFRKKLPVIMTLHGGDIQMEQGKIAQVYLTKQILKFVNVTIALNDRMVTIVKQYCKNVIKIPCSVNMTLFTPFKHKTLIHAKKKLVIIFPSSHDRIVKNYSLFVKTIGELKEKYKIDCREIELKNMTRQQVADTYRTADLMLMTSFSEGSPQVVKEAMACDLPIISTKVGDVDFLLDGVADSGWVDSFNSSLLCEKIKDVVDGKVLGVNGRKKIFDLGLDDDSIARRIYYVYKMRLE